MIFKNRAIPFFVGLALISLQGCAFSGGQGSQSISQDDLDGLALGEGEGVTLKWSPSGPDLVLILEKTTMPDDTAVRIVLYKEAYEQPDKRAYWRPFYVHEVPLGEWENPNRVSMEELVEGQLPGELLDLHVQMFVSVRPSRQEEPLHEVTMNIPLWQFALREHQQENRERVIVFGQAAVLMKR